MSVFDDGSPAAAVAEPGVRTGDGARRTAAEQSGPRPAAPGDAPKILIIEDAPLIALDLAETMKDLGFEVRATVFTHAQALTEIRRSVPEFAVIDLHLGPDETGARQGEDLLSLLDAAGCRCLVFSGDDAACRRVAERYPHFSVIAKPARPGKLAREIERLRRRG